MHKKRKSGGKRAVEAKHKARNAARRRTSAGIDAEAAMAPYAKLGAPPDNVERAHTWLARVALATVHEALHDIGLPPEQRRRDVMKFLEQASKVLDPAKLTEQLDELEQALAEVRAHAGHESTREDSPPSASTDLL